MEIFTPDFIAALIAGAATLVTLATAQSLTRRLFKRQPQTTTLESVLQRLASNTRESVRLIRHAEGEIEARMIAVEDLDRKAREAEQKASLSKEASDAIEQAIRGAIKDENKVATRLNLLVNTLFFVGGAAFSLFLTLVF